jgi:hypothetical protein
LYTKRNHLFDKELKLYKKFDLKNQNEKKGFITPIKTIPFRIF